MANRYANLPGASKIKDTYDRINQGFDLVEQDVDQLRADLDQEIADREAAVEYVDQRVDNIIVGGGPDKDPELVDIRNLDPSYTPQREINVAGDVTRDMQAQFVTHRDKSVEDGVHGMGSAAAQVYEEGTWTPTLRGGTTDVANTYATQVGRFARVGNLVTAWFTLELSSKDPAMAGQVFIVGLPFATDPNARAGCSFGRISQVDLSDGYSALTGQSSGAAIAVIEYGDDVGSRFLTASQIKNDTSFWGSITYKIQ